MNWQEFLYRCIKEYLQDWIDYLEETGQTKVTILVPNTAPVKEWIQSYD